MSSNLLINEPPLQVLPTLATHIGLNDSIFVQQLHYWLSNPKIGREYEGRKWISNTVKQWQEENFPFWHVNTIAKIVKRLSESGILLTEKLNAARGDHTLYYSIDYDALNHFTQRVKSESTQRVKPFHTTCEILESTQRVKSNKETETTQRLHTEREERDEVQPDAESQPTHFLSLVDEEKPTTADSPQQPVKEKQPRADFSQIPASAQDTGFRPNSNKRPEKVFLYGLSQKVSDLDLSMAQFKALVDHFLSCYGVLAVARLDTDHGNEVLRRAQERTLELAALGYRSSSEIDRIFTKWLEQPWTTTAPNGKQLVEYAGKLKSGHADTSDQPAELSRADWCVRVYGISDPVKFLDADPALIEEQYNEYLRR